MHGRQHGTTRSSQQGHLHLFCTRVSLGSAEELLFDMYHSHRAASRGGWGGVGGLAGARARERSQPKPEDDERSSSQSRFWVTGYLPLHRDTEGSQWEEGKKKEKRKKSHQGEQEGAWERWGAELPRVQSKGSPSWRRDGRRIDWRWWTINEVIDSGVRVAGWGLEINWNKHINTSSILHPKHTRTLSRIYYEPCLA